MAITSGTSGNDKLKGTAGWDTLYGLAGNDTLTGGSGSDILSGGDGNDILEGGVGADSLNGGAGNDTFKYTAFADAGGDSIVDFASGDRIDFSSIAGNSFIGNAQFNGVAGEIRYYYYGHAASSAWAYIQIDSDGDAAADYSLTLDGPVRLTQLSGSPGILVLADNQTLNGTSGNNTVNGGVGDDVLSGLGGNDVLNGSEGDDSLLGGDGDDTLNGGLGTDSYTGGGGSDTFRFASPDEINSDTITDFSSDDRIAFAIQGLSYVSDGPFTKTPGQYRYDNGRIDFDSDGDGQSDKSVYLTGYTGMLQETAAGSNILVVAPDKTLTGTSGNDSLTGGNGDDTLSGVAGNDTLSGGHGGDSLLGGDGNDVLIGGYGVDTLTGGAGNDTFKYASLDEIGGSYYGNGDQITDLAVGDKINLSAIDGLSFAGVGKAFTGVANQVSVSNSGSYTYLAVDTDGDGYQNYALQLTGNLTLEETSAGSQIFQVAASQTLTGTSGNDSLTGGNGGDMLSGLAGNDTLSGGYGNDNLDGGDGNDVLIGGYGVDTLTGGAGNDTFKYASLGEIGGSYYGNGDQITDLAVGDKINLSAIDGLSFAGVGSGFTGVANQVSVSNSGSLTYLAIDTDGDGYQNYALQLTGNLTLEETSAGSQIFQVAANQTLTGTDKNNTLTGGNGNDVLSGLGGNDMLSGGYGSDNLDGGDGNDTLAGGLGKDTLAGGAGNDTFKFASVAEIGSGGTYGSYGASDQITDLAVGDKIDLSAIAGLSFVGLGNDFTGVANQVRESATYYNGPMTSLDIDTNGDTYADYTLVLSGSPRVEETAPGSLIFQVTSNQALTGTDKNNTLTGGNGDDTLLGMGGNDMLSGGYGDDSLDGGDGADTLIGGLGNDSLTGGAGNDSFKFTSLAELGDSSSYPYGDTITDFATGDKINLTGVDANANQTGDQAFSFIGSNGFSGAAGELRYQYGSLQGDVNGDFYADFTVSLTGSPTVGVSDFNL